MNNHSDRNNPPIFGRHHKKMAIANKKTVSPTSAIDDVIDEAVKQGDIVPPQGTEKSNGKKPVIKDEVVTDNVEKQKDYSGEEVEFQGNMYIVEAISSTTDKDPASFYMLIDGAEYVLMPATAVPTFFDKAKALFRNKKLYISAGATAAVAVIGAVIIKAASNSSDDENTDDTQNDPEVEATTSA